MAAPAICSTLFGEIPLLWQEKGPLSVTPGAILTNPSRPFRSRLLDRNGILLDVFFHG
jgi:hypothetical protein